ncbi:UDP-galactose transporter senju [Metopolophium dirhodum]|uniref:UDP-galactose transporter senju n=1 Tax=Metopolophium dirhodum TaxID=44670 RepID=UPI00298FF955|nr:UDP-galactose transporter senju [Metopolophium dirhodum]
MWKSSNFASLFPTKTSFVVFVLYIALSMNHGLLVKLSQDKGTYNYNVVSVIILTEVIKLVISLFLFCKDNPLRNIIDQTRENYTVLFLYMVPALLYCLYNNLAFVNLSIFDPTTYFILLQLRVILTGIVYQCLFKKDLSKIQWLSLVLLTIGCMIKEMKMEGNIRQQSYGFFISILLMLTQILCSCLAGVYNEYLLKKGQGVNVNVYVQNIYMYTDSILCNLLLWITFKHNETKSNVSEIDIFKNYMVIYIIINSAMYGVVTSLLLHSLNSIIKVFATAIELVLIAVLSWVLLGYPINLQTVSAVSIVSCSVVIYAKHPITKSTLPDTKSNKNLINI